jgi:hypothetical protein
MIHELQSNPPPVPTTLPINLEPSRRKIKYKSAANNPITPPWLTGRKGWGTGQPGILDQKKSSNTIKKEKFDEQKQRPKLGKLGDLDVPHASAELSDDITTLVRITQGQERSRLGWQRRTSLGRTLTGLAPSRGTNHSVLSSLLKLLTTTRTIRSWSRLVGASSVGCQVSVVNSGDFEMLANILKIRERTHRGKQVW